MNEKIWKILPWILSRAEFLELGQCTVTSSYFHSEIFWPLLLLWYSGVLFRVLYSIYRWWKTERTAYGLFFVIYTYIFLFFRRAEWKGMRVKKGPKVLRLMKILRLRKAMVPPRPPRPRQLSRKSLMASKASKENLGKGMFINDVRHFLAIFDPPTMSDDFYHITSDIFCNTVSWWSKSAKIFSCLSSILILYLCSRKTLQILILNWLIDCLTCNSTSKGQLISKCPFGVFKSSKKRTIFFQDFCPSL